MNARAEDKQKNLSGHILFLRKNACARNPCRNNATCQAGCTHRDYQCLCVLDLDLKATIVIEVRNPPNIFVVSKMNVWPFLIC